MAAQRIRDVQDNCNVKIEIKYDQESVNILSLVLAGSTEFDIIQQDTISLSNNARAGALIGISALDAIDLQDTAKWGDRNILETVCYVDDVYAVVPMAWPDLAYKNFGFLLAYNAGLVSSMGQEDPREYVERGEWDWDKFREVLVNYTKSEGDMTQYALYITYDEWFADMYCRSNGSRLCVKEGDNYVNTFYTEEGKKALQETMDILRNYSEYITYDEANNLSSGNSVMGVIYGTTLFDEVAMEVDDYGVLPYPTGPDVDPSYRFSICESLYCGIAFPVCAKDPDASAIVINEIYKPFEGYETFEDIKNYYVTSFFYDERDAETYFDMYFNMQHNYFGNSGRVLTEGTTDTTNTVATILEQYEDQMEALITDIIKPELQAAELIWG